MMGIILLFIVPNSPTGFVGVAPREITLEIMDSLALTGTGWVKIWFNWYQIKHDSVEYNWTNTDSFVNAYLTRRFNIFVTLQGGNLFYDTLTYTGLPWTCKSYKSPNKIHCPLRLKLSQEILLS